MHLSWLPDSSGLGFKTMYSLPGDTLPTLFLLDLESEDWKSWHVPVSWNGTWGMDGTSYIYDQTNRVEKGLVERDLFTGEERFIYRMPAESQDGIRNLKSSLDYKKLIFRRHNVGWIVLNVETDEAKVLEGVVMRRPTWSPDGKLILAIDRTEGEPDKDKMFIMPEEGGPPKYINLGDNLPKDYELNRAEWSPDGRQIAFHTRTWFHENFFLKNIIPKK